MNKIFKRIVAGVAAAATVVALPISALAYGPVEGNNGRKYFDYNKTSTYPNYPAFNSFSNSPTWGFEPDFMSIKESTSSTWDSDDKITLTPGKTYDVVVLYHNNAPLNTNTAHNTKVSVEFPSVVKGGSSTKGTASVSASNSTPKSIWSTLTFEAQNDILIRYVQNSAFIKYSDNSTKKLPNEGKNLFNGGQLVGKNLDGEVAGCDVNAGMIQFQIVADQPNFTINKQVRTYTDGKAGSWVENATVKAGDKVDFLITYKNTGTIQQNNVVLKDILPKYLTLVKGSTVLYNATNPVSKGGLKVSDNVTGVGINVGNYKPGADALLKFSATVASLDELECGTNTIKNTGRAETDNGSKEGVTTLTVNKTCSTPEPTPEPKPTPELPKSGPETIVGAAVGAGSLIVAGSYYIASRKKLF